MKKSHRKILFKMLEESDMDPIMGDTGTLISTDFFFFVFKDEYIMMSCDVGVSPEYACKVAIMLWEFAKNYGYKISFGDSYHREKDQIFFGDEAASKFHIKNFKETSTLLNHYNDLEQANPEDLNQC